MRFSLGSLLLFVSGAALVTFAGTINSHFLGITLAFFLTIVGTLIGRRRYWSSCLLAALGGAFAMWSGLLLHAFVLPWNHLSDAQQRTTGQEAYQQFVRDTFVPQSAFVMLEGIVLGIFVATMFWVVNKIIDHVSSSGLRRRLK